MNCAKAPDSEPEDYFRCAAKGAQHSNYAPCKEEKAAIVKRTMVSDLRGVDADFPKGKGSRKLNKATDRAYKELEQRKAREVKLAELMVEIKGECNLMGKGKKTMANKCDFKDEGATPVYKWKKERKR
eukprot:TRINITY_DN5122_c0_g1_i4.p2 TRINITY_DN5122_c0_g1~~TRINITY_DN5122_c0_g1_i4.p2  ORF type:complete len:128 (-),score=25.79 TRINITY_DN5122_c0_g1_i4:119-502(-)